MQRLTHERCSGIKTGYWSAAKKDELIERLAAYENTGLEPEEINARLDPADDVVEVVRCFKCKHLMFSDSYGECSRGYMGIVSPTDYCSYGERKDGADNGN